MKLGISALHLQDSKRIEISVYHPVFLEEIMLRITLTKFFDIDLLLAEIQNSFNSTRNRMIFNERGKQ
jgi:hypothetical protein